MYLLITTDWAFSKPFVIHPTVATLLDMIPRVKGSIGKSHVTYSNIQIESAEALVGSRVATIVSEGLYFLLFIAGCLAVILICRRLWKDRPFSSLVHWALLGLGTVALFTSTTSPWLTNVADAMAAHQLGFPTSGAEVADTEIQEWISANGFFDIQNVNYFLFGLGAVLALTSLAFGRGTRLQRGTEGLV
ncbi:hypothetical protein [Paeniglutamicibacter cryotolerans]|uniref:Uncharacterized membrane protein YoaK (UPF0700 family) n=1 Tax=Paeniglutamicibacter cryotolerans TaxID=670079 RepID=A0A839QF44_9MICC|nr:hypothetical protein [Paeniglutamicibacter cryotolerans]MBB2994530.1 uncharacterized membrane protein YoaK (UPF0700 family) [Paeniglutamicibacter cryotolerans]